MKVEGALGVAKGVRELRVHLLQKRCKMGHTGAEARIKHTWLGIISITCSTKKKR